MEVTHNSRDPYFRDPFGAAPTESYVRLAIRIREPERVNDAYLCYSYGLVNFADGRAYLEQNPDEPSRFECRIRLPAEPCLLFYWFEILSGSTVSHCVRDVAANDGSSVLRGHAPQRMSDGNPFRDVFQITVYDKGFQTPDWMKNAVMYQLFPDRFARASGHSSTAMQRVRNDPDRSYHDDWHEDVDYADRIDRPYKACDFFGGSIQGILENLDYIQDLGIGVLYLNPIFESRSNHRYDTGNYARIDPLLGSMEDFAAFVQECERRSIRVVLDGVFSHTGADSIYFNRYGTYDGIGAYQDAEGNGKSPYYSWYHFNLAHGAIAYDSWWGFPELPNVNENDLHFRDYILGNQGIIRKWLGEGASGWRLDVSDELPDSFLRELRQAAKTGKQDCVVLGEVWEDASNKVSYGHYRDFLLGRTHDCVMGYPFRKAVLQWLAGREGLRQTIDALETLRENYPVPAFLCNMNLIGSHDVSRAITELAGDVSMTERSRQAVTFLSEEERERGTRLLKLAMLIQFTFPGVPSVYYGDEVAMEGYGDPFCRRTIDLEGIRRDKPEILLWLTAMSAFRGRHGTLRTGHIAFAPSMENVLVYRRFLREGRDMAGMDVADEESFFVAVNPDNREKVIDVDGIDVLLGPMRGVIVCHRQRVFEV
jgi:glycosidase